MARVRLVQGGNTTAVGASTSRSWGIAGSCDVRIDTDTLNDRQILHRTAGTLSLMEFHIIANSTTGGSSDVTNQQAGSNATLTAAIGTGATGVIQDLTHSDAVASGDKWRARLTVGTGGSITLGEYATSFVASDGSNTIRVANGFDLFHSATSVQSVAGSIANNLSADAAMSSRANFTGTWKNYDMRIGANTHTVTCTYRNRIDAANGTLVLTVASSATGDFSDLSHSDSITPANLINFQMTEGAGANNIVPNYMASDFVITDRRIPYFCTFDGGTSISSGVSTAGLTIGGKLVDLGTASSFVTIKDAGTAENLGANVSANSLNNNLTYTVFNNGSATSIVITYGAAVTGRINDLSHQVLVAVGDQVHIRPNTALAGSGSATQQAVNMDIQLPAPSTGPSRRMNAVAAMTTTASRTRAGSRQTMGIRP